MHRKALLTAFLVTPIVVLIGLVWVINASLQKGIVKQPPVGAGAGDTGGANAIGEAIKARENGVPHATTVAHSDDKAQGAAQAGATMVDPADLPQGFMLVVSDRTGLSSNSSPIYVAGNFNNWNPRDDSYKLVAQSDMKWRIAMVKPKSTANPHEPVRFKFTRGGWEYEMLNADLSVPGDIMLPKIDASTLKAGEIPQIEFTIEAWGDQRPDFLARKKGGDKYRSIQATGTLRRLQVRGGAGAAAGMPRDLLVWLPPSYTTSAGANRTYPVLYMHDGQNLFEAGAAPAEWGMDETAMELMTKGQMQEVIIVGLPHSGATRLLEYMPPLGADATSLPVLEGRAPQGDVHVRWLLREVMPRVERTFRVAKGPENTGIGGSSLGGLISLYAASQHPDVFGKVLAESPSLAFGGKAYWKPVFEPVKAWPGKVFIGVGGRERPDDEAGSKLFEEQVKAFNEFLGSRGLKDGSGKRFVFEPQAVHNEEAWAKRLPGALTFLFPPSSDGSK